MKRRIDRRTVLSTAGAAAFAAAAGSGSAQSRALRGAVTFEGGAIIPKGRLNVYLEKIAASDKMRSRVASMRIKSDGGSKEIGFSLSWTASSTNSQKHQIVARLERKDGWLVARGSMQIEESIPVHIILKTVTY